MFWINSVLLEENAGPLAQNPLRVAPELPVLDQTATTQQITCGT